MQNDNENKAQNQPKPAVQPPQKNKTIDPSFVVKAQEGMINDLNKRLVGAEAQKQELINAIEVIQQQATKNEIINSYLYTLSSLMMLHAKTPNKFYNRTMKIISSNPAFKNQPLEEIEKIIRNAIEAIGQSIKEVEEN